jgi:preprotein translocase subunit SecA
MLEQHIMLNAVDRLWQEHLYAMDSLRDSVRLRSYGQKDPLVEYKNEAYSIFVELMDSIRVDILSNLFRSTTNVEGFKQFLASLHQGASTQSPADQAQAAVDMGGGSSTSTGTGMPEGASTNREDENRPKVRLPIKRDQPKVGRNEPCPCGSGKKYKQCCGR